MAKTKLNGREYVLFVDTTTPVTTAITAVTPDNFKMIMCLTSNGFELTTSPIDSTSKCDGGFASSEAGVTGWSMSADGLITILTAPDSTDGFDENQLFELAKSKASAWFAIMSVTSLGASPRIRYGVGRIDSLSETDPDNETSTFTVSITGIGEPGDQTQIDVTP